MLSFESVLALPATPKANAIYLVPKGAGEFSIYRTSASGALKTLEGLAELATVDTRIGAAVDAVKGGVVAAGDTLAKLYTLISNLQTLVGSDDVTLDTIQEIVTYIKAEQSAMALLGTNKIDKTSIVDALTSTDASMVLSAAQGKVLMDAITNQGTATSLAIAAAIKGRQTSNIATVTNTSVDCSANANYFKKTVNGTTAFTFDNVPAITTEAYGFTLEITHTSGALSFPPSVVFPDNVMPSVSTGKVHIFTFITSDGVKFRGSANTNYPS